MNFGNKNQRMTLKEVAQMFNYSQNSIYKNFKQTAAAIKKKYNIQLIKCQCADGTFYCINQHTQAISLYEQKNNLPITLESLSFESYQFIIFLALSASPQGVFRGTRPQLLKYVGIKSNKKNIQILNQVFKSLEKRQYIGLEEDQEYIILYLRTKLEQEYSISINMLRQCRRIADQNHKNFSKFSQLIRVWEAVRICEQNQPFTYAQLSQMTGLSYKQIRDIKRLLEQNDAFISTRAGSYFKCLGMNVQLNGFFN